jgi:hypothetical protein
MHGRVVLIAASIALTIGAMIAGCATEDEMAYVGSDSGVDAGADNALWIPDSCAKTCSSDRRSLLCDGQVIETCRDDQTCNAGKCMSACELAESEKSSVGCDYFVPLPDTVDDLWLGQSRGSCFAAFIANTWSTPVDISLDYRGQTFGRSDFIFIPSGTGKSATYTPLPDGKLPPGQVAVVFLAAMPSAIVPCPNGVVPATLGDPGVHLTGYSDSFHIQTSAPVTAYDIYPYGGGQSAVTSATLLLPTSVWGKNYVAVDAYSMMPWVSIVAAEDDTDVTLSPTAAIVGRGAVAGTAKGVPQTYTLNRGQLLQFVQNEELVGTPIQSTKPIGVWAGSQCANVPDNTAYCDGAHQQIPPVNALGNEYVAVRYRDRYEGHPESPPWRLIGASDGTQLTYFPAAPAGAPATLNSGQLAEFRAGDPFVVKSQDANHPFYMAGYMTGCREFGTDADCRGDSEFVNVIPAKQYLDSYTFYTDPTYPETNLVVVRTKGEKGFADVKLDCAGALTGWQPLGDSYEWTRVDLVRHNFQAQGACDNGRHEIKSDSPFGVTVWGWGSAETGGKLYAPKEPGFYTQCVSYAYPASAGVLTLTDIVVPPVPK